MYKANTKIKNVHIEYMNMERAETQKADYGVTAISEYKAEELLAMAIENICPDGSYSDFECSVWQTFRNVLRKENLI